MVHYLQLTSSQSLHSPHSSIVAMAPKAKLGKMAMKAAVPKAKKIAKTTVAATTPKKKILKEKCSSAQSLLDRFATQSVPAGQPSPANRDEEDEAPAPGGASSSGLVIASGTEQSLVVHEVEDDTKCNMCDKDITGNDYVVLSSWGSKVYKKCGTCNRLQSRVRRSLQKRGDLKDRWGMMSKDERKAFFIQHHASMGQDLVMNITESTEHSFVRSQETGFATTGDWMDEVDLGEMYKNKPEQLLAIKETSKKMLCPFRGVDLYEHITYASMSKDTEASKMTRNIEMTQDSSLKATKKMKAISEGQRALPGGPPKLSTAALAKLVAFKETMKILSETIKTQNDACHDDVPKKFIDHMQLKLTEMMAYSAEIDVAIEAGTGKIVEFATGAKTVMKAAQAALVTVSNLTATLESM
jgi:hypothetical protein